MAAVKIVTEVSILTVVSVLWGEYDVYAKSIDKSDSCNHISVMTVVKVVAAVVVVTEVTLWTVVNC